MFHWFRKMVSPESSRDEDERLVRENARISNETILAAYQNFRNHRYDLCVKFIEEWIHSIPAEEWKSYLEIHDSMQAMTDDELFAFCSNEYKEGNPIFLGRKKLIKRWAKQAPVPSDFNGSGVAFLLAACCCEYQNDPVHALLWKDRSTSILAGFYLRDEYQQIAINLSKVRNLLAIGSFDEAEEIRREFSLERIQSFYTPNIDQLQLMRQSRTIEDIGHQLSAVRKYGESIKVEMDWNLDVVRVQEPGRGQRIELDFSLEGLRLHCVEQLAVVNEDVNALDNVRGRWLL